MIEEGASTADAVIDAPDDHLAVLPLRGPSLALASFSTRPAWSTTFGRLRRDHDLILVDGGPLFAGLSTPNLPRAVDAAILVHNRALTGPRASSGPEKLLESGGIPLLGLAETFV